MGLYDWKTWVVGSNSGPQLLACFISCTSMGMGTFSYDSTIGAPFYNGSGTTGVIMDNLRAIDVAPYSGSGYPNFYLLEYLPSSNTGIVKEFQQAGAYQGVSFGQGLFYNPLDITTDSIGNIYALDIDSSGSPNIWAFDPTGALIGWTEKMDSTKVSGTALRIDENLSVTPNEVHLLHTLGVTRFAM